MIKKTITYKDYNGVERTEDFYFNLTQAEITEMELGTIGGLGEMIKQIISAHDVPSIIDVFKRLILKSYGEKSADGKYFTKKDADGRDLSIAFSQTEAYSVLFMELATNEQEATKFVNGVMPDMTKYAQNPPPPGISVT